MRCGEGIKLFTSSVMWAVWTEEESHETKLQFRPLAVNHIFHNTYTDSPFCLCKRGGIDSKALKKKVWEKKFWKKNFEKQFLKKKFQEKILEKKCQEKILEKNS